MFSHSWEEDMKGSKAWVSMFLHTSAGCSVEFHGEGEKRSSETGIGERDVRKEGKKGAQRGGKGSRRTKSTFGKGTSVTNTLKSGISAVLCPSGNGPLEQGSQASVVGVTSHGCCPLRGDTPLLALAQGTLLSRLAAVP